MIVNKEKVLRISIHSGHKNYYVFYICKKRDRRGEGRDGRDRFKMAAEKHEQEQKLKSDSSPIYHQYEVEQGAAAAAATLAVCVYDVCVLEKRSREWENTPNCKRIVQINREHELYTLPHTYTQ